MHIRRAHESEAQALSAIACESKAHWPYSVTQLAAWRDDLTVLPGTVSSFPTYVAEVEAGIAGFFVLVPSSLHWKLEHFWVSPSNMGHGVGRALLSRAAALAAEGGATALAIDADPNAEQFYLACGAYRVSSVAAPIEGSPARERPQLLLSTKQPTLAAADAVLAPLSNDVTGTGKSLSCARSHAGDPMTIAFYYSPGSCSLAPHIVLNETGQPFELRKFATADRANYSAEYLAINPKGRIPALQIDGFILTENPAILAFLGRRFPSAGLYPADGSEAEARCLELLAWSSNTVHVAYAQLLRPERFVPNEQNYPPVKESGRINYERCLADIEGKLQHCEYAVGAQFTVVDPFWLVFYRWGIRSGYDMRAKFPAYTAHAERLCSRPSIQRALTTEGISVWK